MKTYPKIIAVLTIALCVLGLQFGSLTAAHADTDADLSVHSVMGFNNGGVNTQVCNNGPSKVKSIVFQADLTNYVIDEMFVSPFGDPVEDNGSFDLNTMTWTGLVGPTSQENCFALEAIGHTTVGIGETSAVTISIVSSVLEDDSPNVDPSSSNDVSVIAPFTIAAAPDLNLTTRLATTGAIQADSAVTYEATIQNVGEGAYVDDGFFMLAFLMPEGSTLETATDGNVSDDLEILSTQEGPSIASLGLTALSSYTGHVALISLHATNPLPPGGSYPLNINIVAGANFAAGDAEVIGLIEGNDADTLYLLKSVADGSNPLNDGIDNVIHLAYDPEALQGTVDRCPGQGETTTDGTGCFRITFNKLIYAPSFTDDVIDLGGNGEVDSLTRLDDYTWEIHVKNITPNSTLQLLLDLNAIQDLSAVQNTTQVLGINTIRYDVAPSSSGGGSTSGSSSGSTSASGTLATTGMHKPDIATPVILILLGAMLLGVSRKRRATVQA